MMVSVATARIPSRGLVRHSAGRRCRARTGPTMSRYRRATPSGETSMPSPRSILSAGPLMVLPPTIGLIAATRDCAPASASRTPFNAKIGPSETNGFDGARMTAADLRIASRTAGQGARPRFRAARFSRRRRARVRARNIPGTASARRPRASRRSARDRRSSAGCAT